MIVWSRSILKVSEKFVIMYNFQYDVKIWEFVFVINFPLGNAYKPQQLKLGSQPRGMDVLKEENIVVTASVNEITVSKDNQKLSTLKVSYEPTSVSCSPRGHVAIGGNTDNKVHVYELKNNNLSPLQELDHLGAVTDVSYSPDDKYLVACDAHRKVVLYSTEEYKVCNHQYLLFYIVWII